MTDPLALYIHWPFCLSRCPYCDFNAHVRPVIDHDRFANALLLDLRQEAARIGSRPLTSIFFGGGTPSLMRPALVATLISAAKDLFSTVPDLEVTLEANPTSVESARLAAFARAGVNRLSIGVQSLDPDALAFLGRRHSAAEALEAIRIARDHVARISFDLIYARPDQPADAWEAELGTALTLGCDHFSLYQLTIEPGTRFEAAHRAGTLVLPDDDHAALLYDRTCAIAAAAGLPRYEVSNYARPGSECRHNLAYWRYNDYAGIGPGAHGRLRINGTRLATRRHRAPEPWAERLEAGQPCTTNEVLTDAIAAQEALLMGLRLDEGITETHFLARTGRTLRDSLHPPALQACIEEGYLSYTGGRLRALPDGITRLDAMLGALVA